MEIFSNKVKFKCDKVNKIKKAYKCYLFKKGVKKYMAFIKELKRKFKYLIGAMRIKRYCKYALKI